MTVIRFRSGHVILISFYQGSYPDVGQSYYRPVEIPPAGSMEYSGRKNSGIVNFFVKNTSTVSKL